MPFTDLWVNAFKLCGAPFHLPLRNQGLILVEGDNLDGTNEDGDVLADSNGAGKSLFMVDAPLWCLYDRLGRYGQRPAGDVVCHPQQGAAVVMGYERAGQALLIERSRARKGRPALTVTTPEGQVVPLSKDPRRRTEDVSEILGMDFAACRASVIVGGDVALAKAGFTAQMGALESLLRLDELGIVAALANERAKALAAQVHAATAVRSTRERAVVDANENLRMVQALNTADHAAALADLDTRIAAAREAQAQLPGAQQAWRECSGKVGDIGILIAAETRTAQSLLEKSQALQDSVTKAACPTCLRPYKKGTELKKLRATALRQGKVLEQQARATEKTLNGLLEEQRVRQQAEETALIVMELRAADANSLPLLEEQRAQVVRTQALHAQQVQLAERQVAAAQEQLAEAKAALTSAAWAHWVQELWSVEFGRDAIQADLFSLAVPLLNEAAERYSRRLMGDGRIVSFNPVRSSRSEDVIRLSGDPDDYDLLSGGEKQRVNLVVAFALRALARSRTPDVNLGIFDETFDHLDEPGLTAVVRLLEEEVQQGGTVIVVTHQPGMKARFPGAKVVRVVRQGGESRVELGWRAA